MKKILFFILILLILSACANNGVTKNGYSVDNKDVNQIKIGVSNKETVINLLDFPTSIYSLNPNKWVYHSYKTKKIMFFKPQVIEQDVIIISFNNANIVENLVKYDLNDSLNIKPSNNKTHIDNREKGLVQDILDNIGSVTPGI